MADIKDFSAPAYDEQGREYVIHRATNVRYYVKDRPQAVQNDRSARAPSAVTHLVSANAKPATRPIHRARVASPARIPSPEFLAACAYVPRALSKAKAEPPAPLSTARAEFIVGSEPKYEGPR